MDNGGATNREMQERLLAIIDAQNQIAEGKLGLGDMLSLVCTRSLELTGADGASVELVDQDRLSARAALGSLASGARAIDEAAERAMGSKTTVSTVEGAVTTTCTPLIRDAHPIGVLRLEHAHSRPSPEDTRTAELLAKIAASAIVNAQVREAQATGGTDEVTGLGDPERFAQHMTIETARRKRYGSPLSLAVFRIERYAEMKAELGPEASDEVVASIAELFGNLRVPDLCFRLEEAEFVVILTNTDGAGASGAARRLKAIIDGAGLASGRATVSFGAAEIEGDDPDDALADARAAASRPAG